MPKFVDKEAKQLDIINAAMKVFARMGIVKTKMADIAEEAGIGKGTIYEYFRSKDEIFNHAFEMFFSEMKTVLRSISESDDDPETQIRQIIKASLIDFTSGNEEFMRIMMDFWAEGIRNKNETINGMLDLEGIYNEFRSAIASILNEGIRKGVFRQVDSNVAAATLIGTMDGLYLQWIVNPSVFNFEQAAGFLSEIFLRGIKIDPSQQQT